MGVVANGWVFFYADQSAFANAHVAMTLVRHFVAFCAMCGWCPACHHQYDAIFWARAQIGESQINMTACLVKGHGLATEGWIHLAKRDGCYLYADPELDFAMNAQPPHA